jgi:hypothetical protein
MSDELTVGQLKAFIAKNNVPDSARIVEGDSGELFCMVCGELYLDKDGDIVLPDRCACIEDAE